jgi:hypothetical protein
LACGDKAFDPVEVVADEAPASKVEVWEGQGKVSKAEALADWAEV